MSDDKFTALCVGCDHFPCALRTDFCEQCIENGIAEMNFGRCYFCRDYHDHEHCIGVPCQCPCPPPDELKRQQERDAVLAKLTPAERQILGY